MARKLVIPISDDLEKEMSKYQGVDWVDMVQKLLTECLHRKEIAEMNTLRIEKAFCNGQMQT